MVIKKKLVIVGDDTSGKTSILNVFCKGQFPEEYMPTTWEDYKAPIKVDDVEIQLALSDTAGDESYDRLRPTLYREADVVLICFSIASPRSLQNVIQKWKPEARHFCMYAPIILLGNKIDLRNDPIINEELKKVGQEIVTREYGLLVAQQINAFAYLECSAKSGYGIAQLFETATKAASHRVNSPTSPENDSRPSSSIQYSSPTAGGSSRGDEFADTRPLISPTDDVEANVQRSISRRENLVLIQKSSKLFRICVALSIFLGILNCILVLILLLYQTGVI